MTVNQLQFVWTGWSGAPGYTNIYCQGTDPVGVQDVANAFRAFLFAIKGELPTEVTITCNPDYRIMNEVTGDLTGVGALGTPPSPVAGGGNPSFAAPAGCTVTWLTSVPAVSRLTTGKTYLVPLGSNAYQNDGTLVEADKAAIAAAAAAFVTTAGGLFVIWRRPVAGAGGVLAEVEASRVNDRVAILRSRRS